MGTQKISFSEADAVDETMKKVASKGLKLWCEGIEKVVKLCGDHKHYK